MLLLGEVLLVEVLGGKVLAGELGAVHGLLVPTPTSQKKYVV
jgi:hypothetical protein